MLVDAAVLANGGAWNAVAKVSGYDLKSINHCGPRSLGQAQTLELLCSLDKLSTSKLHVRDTRKPYILVLGVSCYF